ncbi:cation:proton antiporter [Alkaliphilus oremlandii]|uniref:Sodium/hydrogen exchanger n=1 Tax=Alkaliphilus oremlandii (strain OhILAs) TaxID=350688 RepID=A8MF25_ALKOO|nr:cation:proton antiporter [Alkaliphilus oremlandii]ABW18694.1 sodium/hydrogen exchanger [Alkaliphilus oremlandii OhILAs]
MLTSLALIFLLGLTLGSILNKLKLPSLLGMMIAGMILSPYGLNLLHPSILEISSDLRQLALIIILTRAGLSFNIGDLKKVGRPALLMCFVPACFEIIGVTVIATRVMAVSFLDAAIMGSVLAAVSPAVVVPRMIKIIEEGYGKERSIPQLILAGASVDDVFVIVLFTAFTSLASGGKVSIFNFLQIPVSIILGIMLGALFGLILVLFLKKISVRDSVRILIVLSVSFLLMEIERQLNGILPVSGLLAILSMGIMIYRKDGLSAKQLSMQYNKLWVAAEILLFVLVGAAVDLSYATKAGTSAVIIVLCALIFRMVGVFIYLLKTTLLKKEKLFCMVAYTPKATVQAAIGAIPLSMGLPSGQNILTVAVVSILITAPLGAIGIDKLYKKLLN